MSTKTVLDLKIGEEAVIKDFSERGVACRLLTVGIIPSTKIKLVRKSPLGSAVCIRLGKTNIAIRRSEARSIIIS